MSTKIYNARITEEPYWKVLICLANAKTKLQADWVRLCDIFAKSDKPFEIARGITDEIHRGLNGCNPTCSVVLYASRRKRGSIIYDTFGLDNAQSKIVKKALAPLKSKDFGYWDNTDMPEDVTVKEWVERLKDWNLIFSGTTSNKGRWKTPAECGASFDFITKEWATEVLFTSLFKVFPPVKGSWWDAEASAMFAAQGLRHAYNEGTQKVFWADLETSKRGIDTSFDSSML